MLQMQKTMSQVVNYIATRAKANANGLCARVISLLTCALSIVSCEPYIPMVNLGIDDTYAIERMRTLILHPEYEGEHYEWWICEAKGKRVPQNVSVFGDPATPRAAWNNQ